MVVPHERRCCEADLPSTCLQSPAHVDVIARPHVDRVEAVDGQQRVTPERHVAAWYVLGNPIVEQHMCRCSRSPCDALRHWRIIRRHDVRPAGTDHVRRQKRLDEIREPVAIRPRVRIRIRDDVSGGLGQPDVPGRGQPAIRDVDHADASKLPGHFRGAISRSVIDDDDLVVGIGESLERAQAIVERLLGVVRANYHRHPRPAGPFVTGEGGVPECRRNGSRGQLGMAVLVDYTKGPVVDRATAPPPVVGPCERDGAAGALSERRADMASRDLGLSLVALVKTARSGLREQ